jgi:hypothetical protein
VVAKVHHYDRHAIVGKDANKKLKIREDLS